MHVLLFKIQNKSIKSIKIFLKYTKQLFLTDLFSQKHNVVRESVKVNLLFSVLKT